MNWAALGACYADQAWRLDNLYYITDRDGKRILFKMNRAQRQLLKEMSFRNIILKARQLGFTTFIQIFMLDMAVFHEDTQCAVIAQTEDVAEGIFREKLKYAFDGLPQAIRDQVSQKPKFRYNTTELFLSNGSGIRVSTSVRGGTLQYLHVSEFGKIAAKNPEKAREIVTGALNTLGAEQVAFIESTAEGQDGRFYNMCMNAMQKRDRGDKLTAIDWKFFFFPWWEEPTYTISPTGIELPEEFTRYFSTLKKEHGIALSDGQKAWYYKKQIDEQGEDMKREFPSYPEEAFEQALEGAYYAVQMMRADKDGRIRDVPFNPALEVETWWDIGFNDSTAIWFVQRDGDALKVINYFEDSEQSVEYYAGVLKDFKNDLGYRYSRHVFPHDVKKHDWSNEDDTKSAAEKRGIKPIIIIPKLSVQEGINKVRTVLARCYFDKTNCEEGLKYLREYRKEWDEKHSRWRNTPRHDENSHGADAFRYGALAPEPGGKYSDQDTTAPDMGFF